MERIKLIKEYYDPLPRVLVVDFGSSEIYGAVVSDICSAAGFSYYHEPDIDTYSPAAAHNRGYEQAETDLIFFCDADCFGARDMFDRLAKLATSLRMREVIDTPLVLPVYHLNEADTKEFYRLQNPEDRSNYLDAFTYYSGNASYRKAENFFIAPYSNIFLINKRMFSLTGGYDERFRGHGSEDFEYLTRLSFYLKNLPMPVNITTDWLGPLGKHFHKARPYSGFRRLLEALAKPAENFGLKVHHLYHPKPKAASWESNNDWKRERMNEAFSAYIETEHNLLSIDFLAREKAVACLCKHVDQWGYYTPLRAAGFKLLPIFDDQAESIQLITDAILNGRIQALAIFNPHMKSHAKFKQLVLLARERGLQVIVIERGALPGTIYYDTEVAYESEAFSEEQFLAERFTSDELAASRAYCSSLRSGSKTLESMDSYEETKARHAALSALERPICFVPLQLEDDMAVTMFLKGEQTYHEFAASLEEVIDQNPEIIFVVKPHPLSKLDPLRPKPNLIIASREDNIHFLLDAASFVVCYNSGVGLLSLIHETPTATLGNAFYNLSGAGIRCSSLTDAISQFKDGSLKRPPRELVDRIVAWFTLRKYSNFIATDSISEFAIRKAHGYRDILVTHFRWNGLDIPMGRQRQVSPFTNKSYLWSQIGDTLNSAPSSKQRAQANFAYKPVPMLRKPLVPIVRPFIGKLGNKQDLRDFDADPSAFFASLRNRWYREVGAVLFPPERINHD
jgi:predicted glycosyltransferase involved in capsule biosynthesis